MISTIALVFVCNLSEAEPGMKQWSRPLLLFLLVIFKKGTRDGILHMKQLKALKAQASNELAASFAQ